MWPARPWGFATWLESRGEQGRRAAHAADELWEVYRGSPHTMGELIGAGRLDPFTESRLCHSVLRARKKFRRYQVEELLRKMDGDRDPMGMGRVISLLGALEVGG